MRASGKHSWYSCWGLISVTCVNPANIESVWQWELSFATLLSVTCFPFQYCARLVIVNRMLSPLKLIGHIWAHIWVIRNRDYCHQQLLSNSSSSSSSSSSSCCCGGGGGGTTDTASCFLLCCFSSLESYTCRHWSISIIWLLQTAPQHTLFYLAIIFSPPSD